MNPPSQFESISRKSYNIINYAYQQKPDDVVGKMTISRLDQEMRLWEQTHKPRGDCSCSPAGVPAGVAPVTRPGLVSTPITAQLITNNRVGDDGRGKLPQLHKWIRIYCSITRKASIEDGYPIAKHIETAKDRLFEYGWFFPSSSRQGLPIRSISRAA